MKEKIYRLFYDSPIDIIKICFPVGFHSNYVAQGYAHFIEHLVIRNNYDILKEIELSGGWFNGTTREDRVEIVIYVVSNNIELYSADKLMEKINLSKFYLSKYDIENEIKVIKNEYETLLISNSKHDVEQRIGNIEQINKFNIDDANNILKNISKNINIFVFSKRYSKESNIFGNFSINIFNESEKYLIRGENKYSSDKLKLIFALLLDMGYSTGVDIIDDTIYIEKNMYENINACAKNINRRFKILVNTSFSKYSMYINMIDNEQNAFLDFDFYNLWRKIDEQKNDLFKVY